MGKLHELLAVEGDLKGQAQRDLHRALSLFTDGKGKLVGSLRSYQPLQEGGEDFADEVTLLASTVEAELDQVSSAFGRWMDAAVQKETTNRDTAADIVVDGVTIVENLPAPALLNLESKLAEIRKVYAAIPTNDPAERWEWAEQLGCWLSRPRTTYKTKKVPRAHVAYEATAEHPAQVQVFNEDVRVGEWTTVIESGMLTPQDKRRLLARLDVLARAVKQARQRANDIDAVNVEVAQKLFAFIRGE